MKLESQKSTALVFQLPTLTLVVASITTPACNVADKPYERVEVAILLQ